MDCGDTHSLEINPFLVEDAVGLEIIRLQCCAAIHSSEQENQSSSKDQSPVACAMYGLTSWPEQEKSLHFIFSAQTGSQQMQLQAPC